MISPEECSCTCPDFYLRKNCCKHIYFIFNRIALKEDLLKKINTSDLTIDEESWNSLDVEITGRLKTRLDGNEQSNTNLSSIAHREECNECAICFEGFTDNCASFPSFESCSHCQNRFHQVCIQKWLESRTYNPTCPLCRGLGFKMKVVMTL